MFGDYNEFGHPEHVRLVLRGGRRVEQVEHGSNRRGWTVVNVSDGADGDVRSSIEPATAGRCSCGCGELVPDFRYDRKYASNGFVANDIAVPEYVSDSHKSRAHRNRKKAETAHTAAVLRRTTERLRTTQDQLMTAHEKRVEVQDKYQQLVHDLRVRGIEVEGT